MTDELDDAFGRGWFEQPGDVGTELLLEERIRRLRIVRMATKAALRVRQNPLVSQDDVHAAAQWRPAGRELRRIRLDPVDHGKQIGILPRLRVGVIGQPDSAAAEQQSEAESGAELGRHGVLRPGNRYTVGNRERRHPEPDLDDIPRPAGNAHREIRHHVSEVRELKGSGPQADQINSCTGRRPLSVIARSHS
jgi:hypothetical protein